MKCKDKPDYKLWAKKEGWTLKEATLLLHRLDPFKHRGLRIYDRDAPPEFEQEAKTYMLLRSVNWRGRYPDYCYGSDGTHPMAMVVEAFKKELPVPPPLLKAVKERCERERKEEEGLVKKMPAVAKENKALPLATRERRNLLKILGIFVHLSFGEEKNQGPRYRHGGKLNAYQIAQKALEKAGQLGLELDGLKSVDRKITEALELLEEERQ